MQSATDYKYDGDAGKNGGKEGASKAIAGQQGKAGRAPHNTITVKRKV